MPSLRQRQSRNTDQTFNSVSTCSGVARLLGNLRQAASLMIRPSGPLGRRDARRLTVFTITNQTIATSSLRSHRGAEDHRVVSSARQAPRRPPCGHVCAPRPARSTTFGSSWTVPSSCDPGWGSTYLRLSKVHGGPSTWDRGVHRVPAPGRAELGQLATGKRRAIRPGGAASNCFVHTSPSLVAGRGMTDSKTAPGRCQSTAPTID